MLGSIVPWNVTPISQWKQITTLGNKNQTDEPTALKLNTPQRKRFKHAQQEGKEVGGESEGERKRAL